MTEAIPVALLIETTFYLPTIRFGTSLFLRKFLQKKEPADGIAVAATVFMFVF